MALAVKGTANADRSSDVTIPSHVAGDIIVIYAARNATAVCEKPSASGTVPAWQDIDATDGANLISSRTAYFVATANNHTSGTWTYATAIIAVVLSGQHATPIGGHDEDGATDATYSIAPAVTMSNTSGTSVLLEFHVHRATQSWSDAPTGYTRQVASSTATNLLNVCLNTKNTTTSDGAIQQDQAAGTTQSYRGATVEILSAVTAQNIGGTLAVTATATGEGSYGQTVGGTLTGTATTAGEADFTSGTATQNIGGVLAVTVEPAGSARLPAQSVAGALALQATVSGAAASTIRLVVIGGRLVVSGGRALGLFD